MTEPDRWADFLTARLAEREALAKAAWQSQWVVIGSSVSTAGRSGVPPLPVADTMDSETAGHVAANDPAWVLEDVASKREILAAHTGRPEHRCPLPVLAGPAGQLWTPEEGACWTVRLLARPWISHPDHPEHVAEAAGPA
jgi:hypothetical protein